MVEAQGGFSSVKGRLCGIAVWEGSGGARAAVAVCVMLPVELTWKRVCYSACVVLPLRGAQTGMRAAHKGCDCIKNIRASSIVHFTSLF